MARLSDVVGQVLETKGSAVVALPPGAKALAAVRLMARENVGSVVVALGGSPVGVFSERDCARRLAVDARALERTLAEVMTSPPAVVSPRASVETCLELMTARRQRHLPVVSEGRLVGLVSIGDLVKWLLESRERTIQHLEDYICGRYPG